MRAHRIHFCGVNQPFIAVCHNADLIVYTLKDDGYDVTIHKTGTRLCDLDILRTDYNIDRRITAESLVDTWDLHT